LTWKLKKTGGGIGLKAEIFLFFGVSTIKTEETDILPLFNIYPPPYVPSNPLCHGFYIKQLCITIFVIIHYKPFFFFFWRFIFYKNKCYKDSSYFSGWCDKSCGLLHEFINIVNNVHVDCHMTVRGCSLCSRIEFESYRCMNIRLYRLIIILPI
jgi:hypothetical protein